MELHHRSLMSVGDEPTESGLLLFLMGKKSLKCFKEKCFMSVAVFFLLLMGAISRSGKLGMP